MEAHEAGILPVRRGQIGIKLPAASAAIVEIR